jgi:hypothetical protein
MCLDIGKVNTLDLYHQQNVLVAEDFIGKEILLILELFNGSSGSGSWATKALIKY